MNMSYGNAPRQNYRPAASKQDWTVGQTVKVGFMTLKVLAKVATPGDYMPDAYALETNGKFYRFVPHNGLARCANLEEAMAA
jgi:hypothetical protein